MSEPFGNSEELAPCPFCGNENIAMVACSPPNGGTSDGRPTAYVVCRRCAAFGPVTHAENYRADAVAKWNTRPAAAAEQAAPVCEWCPNEAGCSKCRDRRRPAPAPAVAENATARPEREPASGGEVCPTCKRRENFNCSDAFHVLGYNLHPAPVAEALPAETERRRVYSMMRGGFDEYPLPGDTEVIVQRRGDSRVVLCLDPHGELWIRSEYEDDDGRWTIDPEYGATLAPDSVAVLRALLARAGEAGR